MTTIKTHCPFCGDLVLTEKDLKLRLQSNGVVGVYDVYCPYCKRPPFTRPANHALVNKLLEVGVEYKIDKRLDPPVSEKDIEEFVRGMDDDKFYLEIEE